MLKFFVDLNIFEEKLKGDQFWYAKVKKIGVKFQKLLSDFFRSLMLF